MKNNMNCEDLLKQLKAEREERTNSPWYKRIPLNVGEYVWYRMWGGVKDWPSEIKWTYQEITRGYSDCDIWNLNDFIIRKVRLPLKAYVRHQEEHGMATPFDFATNPVGWLEVLAKMEYSFDETYNDRFLALDQPKRTPEQMEEYNKKIQEGFELFGKYCMNLWD